MERKISIDLKTLIIIVLLVILFVVLGIFIYDKNSNNNQNTESVNEVENNVVNEVENRINNEVENKVKHQDTDENYRIENYDDRDYYIIEDDYSGEYDLQIINLGDYFVDDPYLSSFPKMEAVSYDEYAEYCDEWGIDQRYDDEEQNYIIVSYCVNGSAYIDARLSDVEYSNKAATLYVWDDFGGLVAGGMGYAIIVPTTKNISKVKVQALITEESWEEVLNPSETPDVRSLRVDKPIIYLYPEEQTKVSVELKRKENITCSYPKYVDGWKVIAEPNGDLIDIEDGRKLYSLYYECENEFEYGMTDEGFVIEGKDSAEFLEEKLSILGLNEKETEEFIIYWLPKLEANKYNYIRFATYEEIDENMPLEVTPTPDTKIRIVMIFKGLDEQIEIKEQKLDKAERNGFTVVEWGGTELK